jgi:hypothetical protein
MLGVCRVSPAARRSFVIGVAFALATVVTTPSFAQDPVPEPEPEAQAAPQEPEKPVLTLEGDAAVISILIKPDKVADFEEVLTKLKEALQKSENATRRQQAAGWKIFKSPQMAQGSAVYVFVIDPVVKGEEYDISRLIAEVFPVEVQELFVKYRDSFAGRAISTLNSFMVMGQ